MLKNKKNNKIIICVLKYTETRTPTQKHIQNKANNTNTQTPMVQTIEISQSNKY